MPVPVPNQNLQDNGPLIELLRNALTSNSSIGRVAEQLGMSMAQITELLKGTTRPRDFNVRPPPKPSVFNIGTPTRDRSRSPPPGDEEMLQTVDPPPPPPTKSTYGPMGRRPLRADPYEPTPQLARPKPLPSGTPVPETPQVARSKPRPSRAPVPDTPQMVRAPPVTRAASVPETPQLVRASSARSVPRAPLLAETPVLPRGLSQDTVGYPSRSRSRALSETPQFQPPARRATLPLADEPETPQLVRGRSQGERTLGPVLEETPQMPEKLRRKFEKQTQRAQRQGQLRLELGKFTEQHRARLAAQEAEQRARSVVLRKPTVTEAIQAIERSGGRPADELSPKVRKKSVPIGAFMSRQKTLGGEVRRYKPIGLA